MRRRKLLIGALLAFAIAFLGVGYATITARTLTVNGSVSVTAPNAQADVKFTAVAEQGTSTPEAAAVADTTATPVATTANQTISVSVTGLANKNDTLTFRLTYENFSTDYVANLDTTKGTVAGSGIVISNTNTEYFSVSTGSAAASLQPNGEGTLDVTVTLIKQPVADQTTTITITLDYLAAALSA